MKIKTLLLALMVMISFIIPYPGTVLAQNASPFSDLLCRTDIRLNTSARETSSHLLTRHYALSDLTQKPTEGGLQFELAGCETLQIPNCPAFPYEKITITLNPGETLTSLKILSLNTIELPAISIPLALAQEPKTILHRGTGQEPNQGFEIPSIFPEQNAHYRVIRGMDTNQGVIDIMPMYQVGKHLVLATEMKFVYGIGRSDNTSFHQAETKETSIILTDAALENAGKKLQALHQADGYNATLVLVEDIASMEESDKPVVQGVQGFMDVASKEKTRIQAYDYSLARKIQTWLRQQNQSETLQFLTILGDATVVPPSYYLVATDNMSDYDRWVPTDFFYYCPSTTYVGSDSAELQFDYAVGRLPARDLEEANTIVDKISRYRKKLNPDWFKKFAVFAGDPFNEDCFGELSTSKAINQNYLDGFEVEKYYRSEGLFSTDPFLKVMSEGKRGIVWGFGHGSGDGLALEPGYADSRQIMALPQKDEYPIFLSEACGNGAYDSRLAKGPFGSASAFTYPTSFSEAVLNARGGGIAYVGGARINYAGWSMSYTNGIPTLHRVYYMDAMLEYFMKSFTEKGGSLGKIAQATLQEYAENDWFDFNAPLVKTFFGFCLQGDPTLRLPSLADQQTDSTPVLSYSEKAPMNPRQIPLFSIDNGVKISVQTDAKKIRTVLVDYDNAGKRVWLDDWNQNPTKSLQAGLQKFPKSRLALRCLTPEGKESRMVFYGRYNHDLVIKKPYDLDWVGKDEKKSYYCQVFNDGLFAEKDIQMTIKRHESILQDTQISEIPVMGSRYVYYKLDQPEEGNDLLVLACSQIPNETVISDNTLQVPLRVTEQKPFRVGVLNASSLLDFNYYKDRLELSKLNKYFREQNHSIDFSIIPIGMDTNYQTLLTRLRYDAVLLYTTNFFDYPIREILSILEDFSDQGGLVFGMLSLGSNGHGLSMQDFQAFFGISPQERILQYNLENKANNFEIISQDSSLFPQVDYQLSSRYTCKPSNKNWDKVELIDQAELIGLSESGLYGLIKNRNRYFYSGFLSEVDFKKSDDSQVFFEHLFTIIEQPRMDISIKNAVFVPTEKPEEMKIEAILLNAGNQVIPSCSVMLDNQIVQTTGAIAPKTTLPPLQFTIPAESALKQGNVSFRVMLPEIVSDVNPLNNEVVLSCQAVLEKKYQAPNLQVDPDTPPWINLAKPDQMISPSCVVTEDNTLFISQANGIFEIDQSGAIQAVIPYDPQLIEVFGASHFRELSSMPNRSFLRKTGNRLIISDLTKIAVLDYPTGKLKHVIHHIQYLDYATPLVLFDQLYEIEVSGETAYVLDPYVGLSLINLSDGTLITKIPVSDYLWDIDVKEQQLYGCTFYGLLFAMNLDGSNQTFYELPMEMYCYSFMAAPDGFYYFNTLMPDRTLLKISLDQEKATLEESIKLPSQIRGLLERMDFSGEYCETIAYITKRSGSFGIESKWFRLNDSFTETSEPGKNHLRQVMKDKNYMTHPKNVWLIEDNQILVSMGYPSNPYQFRLFDQDGILVKNLKTGSDIYDNQVLHCQYIGDHRIGMVVANRNFMIHLIDFSEKKVKTKTIFLNTGKAGCSPEKFWFTEDSLITLDRLSGKIILFDLETGLESDRFSLVDENQRQVLYKPLVMQSIEDQLYLLDPFIQCIFIYELSSGSYMRSIPLPASPIINDDQFLLKILNPNEILLLDSCSGQLYYWDSINWSPQEMNQSLIPWQNPISMDYREGCLVVNDAGHERLQKYCP